MRRDDWLNCKRVGQGGAGWGTEASYCEEVSSPVPRSKCNHLESAVHLGQCDILLYNMMQYHPTTASVCGRR